MRRSDQVVLPDFGANARYSEGTLPLRGRMALAFLSASFDSSVKYRFRRGAAKSTKARTFGTDKRPAGPAGEPAAAGVRPCRAAVAAVHPGFRRRCDRKTAASPRAFRHRGDRRANRIDDQPRRELDGLERRCLRRRETPGIQSEMGHRDNPVFLKFGRFADNGCRARYPGDAAITRRTSPTRTATKSNRPDARSERDVDAFVDQVHRPVDQNSRADTAWYSFMKASRIERRISSPVIIGAVRVSVPRGAERSLPRPGRPTRVRRGRGGTPRRSARGLAQLERPRRAMKQLAPT